MIKNKMLLLVLLALIVVSVVLAVSHVSAGDSDGGGKGGIIRALL